MAEDPTAPVSRGRPRSELARLAILDATTELLLAEGLEGATMDAVAERAGVAKGRPGAQRAVGLANARNPIAIIVPCHRVIGASGALTGYGGGLERKQALLDLEARHRPDPGLRGLGHELDPGAGQLSSAAPSMP